jgi:hypothetical protein
VCWCGSGVAASDLLPVGFWLGASVHRLVIAGVLPARFSC